METARDRLEFINISYEKKGKTILDNISGCTVRGKTLAIMGKSGSGKTSLLNIIAQRIKKFEGFVSLEGELCTRRKMKRSCAFVQQSDNDLKPYMTVRENLKASCMLSSVEEYSKRKTSKREETFASNAIKVPTLFCSSSDKVNDILDILKLNKCADNLIGSISGGEKRRTSIGCQMVRTPEILILDEPTSGLDSDTASKLCEDLVSLAEKRNIFVVFSVHQPSWETYSSFSKVIILGEEGKCLHNGTPEESLKLIPCFQGFSIEEVNRMEEDDILSLVPRNSNPIDYIMKNIEDDLLHENSEEEPVHSEEEEKQVDSEEKRNFLYKFSRFFINRVYGFETFLLSFIILLWRNCIEIRRNWLSILYSLIIKNTILAVLTLLIFFNMNNDQQSIIDRFGCLYYVLSNMAFGGIWCGIVLLRDRFTINRERANGLYSGLTNYLSIIILQIPFFLIDAFLSTIIIYPAVFGRSVSGGAFFVLVLFLCELTSHALGYTLASVSPNGTVAITLMSMMTIIFLSLGGWIRRNNRMPLVIEQASYISYLRYAFYALSISEFQDLSLSCNSTDIHASCFTNGNQVLEYNNIGQDLNIWENVSVLIGMLLIYHVLAIFFSSVLYTRQGRK